MPWHPSIDNRGNWVVRCIGLTDVPTPRQNLTDISRTCDMARYSPYLPTRSVQARWVQKQIC